MISQGHKSNPMVKPHETITKVMDGREPKLLMNIHSVSDVNKD